MENVMNEETAPPVATQESVVKPGRRGGRPRARVRPKKAQEPFAPIVSRRAGRAKPERDETEQQQPRAAGRLKRRRHRGDDRFAIPKGIVPPGFSYEWKRESVFGKPDPYHQSGLRENHWTPVPAERHPGLLVKQDGMILMERPSYLTDEAHEEDFKVAMEQVQIARSGITDTPQGQFTRAHDSARRATKINTDYNTYIRGGQNEEK